MVTNELDRPELLLHESDAFTMVSPVRRLWHIVTGEYPPDSGGVADYTAAVARALADSGAEVHVWSTGDETERSRLARRDCGPPGRRQVRAEQAWLAWTVSSIAFPAPARS